MFHYLQMFEALAIALSVGWSTRICCLFIVQFEMTENVINIVRIKCKEASKNIGGYVNPFWNQIKVLTQTDGKKEFLFITFHVQKKIKNYGPIK